MMSKLIMLFLTFIFCFHSFAASIDPLTINQIVDEFQYELTVNWDQQDQKELKVIREKYLNIFEEMRTQGLTYEELYRSLEPRINPFYRVLINHQMKDLRTGKINETQALESLLKGINQSRPMGASWNGKAGEIILLSALVGFIGFLFVKLTISISRCGTNPKYCCPYYGWTDSNGNGYCDPSEEIQRYK